MQVRRVDDDGTSSFQILPFLTLENCLPVSLRVIFKSSPPSQATQEKSWKTITLKQFPAIEESQGFLLESGENQKIYHNYFDGEGTALLNIVGTEEKFELERKKVFEGEDNILTTQIREGDQVQKTIHVSFAAGHAQIIAEYVLVNSTDKALSIAVSPSVPSSCRPIP